MFSCNDTYSYCCRGLAITMVVSLLFILLLRYIAGLIVWLVIIGVVSAVGYGECPQTSSPCQWLHLMHVLEISSALVMDLSCLPLLFSQVSGIVTGCTLIWARSQTLTSPSLISASKQTSAFTLRTVRHGSSSVCCLHKNIFNFYKTCTFIITR